MTRWWLLGIFLFVSGSAWGAFNSQFPPFANVKDFGAKGDGVTDDSSALQAAVNVSSAVYFPCGTYKSESLTVTSRSGVKLWGAGWCTVLKLNTSIGGTLINLSSSTDVEVRDFVLDGSSTSDTNNAWNCLSMDGCQRCSVIHNKMINCMGDGIHMVSATRSSSHNTISGNYITGVSGNGINCFNTNQDEDDILDNEIYVSNAASGQAGQMELTNSRIMGNVFDGGSSIGLTLAGDGSANRADNLVLGNRFYGGTYALEFGSFQDGTTVIGNHIEGSKSGGQSALKASVGGSGKSGQITIVGNSIYHGSEAVTFPANGSSAWLFNSNYVSKSSATQSSAWVTTAVSSATISGNIFDATSITTGGSNIIDQVLSNAVVVGNQFLGSNSSGQTAVNANGVTNNAIALNKSINMTDVTTNVNSFGNFIIDSTGTIRGATALSGDRIVAPKNGNLRGSVTISGASTSGTVTFGQSETDGNYFVSAVVGATSGSPAAGSTRVYVTGKGTTGFTVNDEVAPGAGNSVTVDWHLIR